MLPTSTDLLQTINAVAADSDPNKVYQDLDTAASPAEFLHTYQHVEELAQAINTHVNPHVQKWLLDYLLQNQAVCKALLPNREGLALLFALLTNNADKKHLRNELKCQNHAQHLKLKTTDIDNMYNFHPAEVTDVTVEGFATAIVPHHANSLQVKVLVVQAIWQGIDFVTLAQAVQAKQQPDVGREVEDVDALLPASELTPDEKQVIAEAGNQLVALNPNLAATMVKAAWFKLDKALEPAPTTDVEAGPSNPLAAFNDLPPYFYLALWQQPYAYTRLSIQGQESVRLQNLLPAQVSALLLHPQVFKQFHGKPDQFIKVCAALSPAQQQVLIDRIIKDGVKSFGQICNNPKRLQQFLADAYAADQFDRKSLKMLVSNLHKIFPGDLVRIINDDSHAFEAIKQIDPVYAQELLNQRGEQLHVNRHERMINREVCRDIICSKYFVGALIATLLLGAGYAFYRARRFDLDMPFSGGHNYRIHIDPIKVVGAIVVFTLLCCLCINPLRRSTNPDRLSVRRRRQPLRERPNVFTIEQIHELHPNLKVRHERQQTQRTRLLPVGEEPSDAGNAALHGVFKALQQPPAPKQHVLSSMMNMKKAK